jgi:hypothetical protein
MLVLVYSFGDFSPWLTGPIALGLWQYSTSQQEHMVAEASSLLGQELKKRVEETYIHSPSGDILPMF